MKFWVEINCLRFDDDTATIGGVITKVAGELPPGFPPEGFPPDLVGYVARVTVVDNGEGSAAEEPDQLSPVTIWWPPPDPNVCVFGPVEGEKFPLSGNIQVQK